MSGTETPKRLPRRLVFEEFRVEVQARVLTRNGEGLPITPTIFELLVAFLERPGELLSREELFERVWPGKILEDANLTQSVFVLRKLLGDTGPEHRLIVTEPGRGYRFVGDVRPDEEGRPEAGTLPGRRGRPPRRRSRSVLAGGSVALLVIVVLALGLTRAERPAPTLATEDLETLDPRTFAPRGTSFPTYEAVLEGRYHMAARDREGFSRARAAYRRALGSDPEHASAWSGLATAELLLGFYRLGEVPPLERYRVATEAARRAVELDPSLATPHALLGMLAMLSDHDLAAAERHMLRALSADPGARLPHQWYSWVLLAGGRTDEAGHEIELAYRTDPMSLIVRSARSYHAYYAGRYEEALRGFDGILAINERFGRAHLNRGLALEQLGRFGEAEAAFRRAAEVLGETDEVRAYLAHLYGLSGRREDWEDLMERWEPSHASPALSLLAYAGVGDAQRVLSLLERAIERREIWVWDVRYDPRLAPFRAEPAFRRFLSAL